MLLILIVCILLNAIICYFWWKRYLRTLVLTSLIFCDLIILGLSYCHYSAKMPKCELIMLDYKKADSTLVKHIVSQCPNKTLIIFYIPQKKK